MHGSLSTGCALNLHLKMLVTVKYLATGNFLLTIADSIDMSKSSACRALGEIDQQIAYLAPDYIKFPDPEEAHRLAQKILLHCWYARCPWVCRWDSHPNHKSRGKQCRILQMPERVLITKCSRLSVMQI